MLQEQKDNVTKLIAALRSGEFAQGTGALCEFQRDENGDILLDEKPKGYCCLGVAGKLLGYTDVELRRMKSNFPAIGQSIGGFLTNFAADKFGFDPGMQRELARRNDEVGSTFEKVAAFLEQWLRSQEELEQL